MANPVKNIKLKFEQNTNTVRASWSGTKPKNFKHYKVKWFYKTQNGSSYPDGDGSTTSDRHASFNPPNNAVSVKLSVNCVCKKKTYPAAKSSWKSVLSHTMKRPSAPKVTSILDDEYKNPIFLLEMEYEDDETSSATHLEIQYHKARFQGTDPKVDIEPVPATNWLDGSAPKAASTKTTKAASSKKKLQIKVIEDVHGVSALGAKNPKNTQFDMTQVQNAVVAIKRGAAQYEFKTVQEGFDYQFSVRAVKRKSGNNVAQSEWSPWSDIISGPFIPPSSAVGIRYQTPTEVHLTFKYPQSLRGQYVQAQIIPDDPNFSWEALKDRTDLPEPLTSALNSKVIIVTGLQPIKHWIRARVSKDSSGRESVSQWTIFPDVFINTASKHEPPSTWSSKSVASTDEEIYFYWNANSKDGSKVKFSLVTFVVNGETFTEEFDHTNDEDETETDQHAKYVVKKFAAPADITWYVQTSPCEKSADDRNYSDPSMTREVHVYRKPELSVSIESSIEPEEEAEGPTIGGFPIDIMIDSLAGSNQGLLYYYIEIQAVNQYSRVTFGNDEDVVPEGTVMYKSTEKVQNDHSELVTRYELELTPGDVRLDDKETYRIIVQGSYDSGLSASAECEFTFDPYVDDEITISMDNGEYDKQTASIVLYPRVEKNREIAPGFSIFIYREQYDGALVPLSNIAIQSDDGLTGIADPHPNFGTVTYQVVAIDNETGAYYFETVYEDIPESALIITWNEQWGLSEGYETQNRIVRSVNTYSGNMLRLPYNIDMTFLNKKDVELVNYIGRENSVAYYGTQQGYVASYNSDIPYDDPVLQQLLDKLMRYDGDVYVRDPSGKGFWANVVVSYNKKSRELRIPISITANKVEGGA